MKIIFNVSKGVIPSSKKVWWIIHNMLNYSKHLISWLSFHTGSLLICITYPNTKCYGNNRVWKKRVECWEYIKCFSKGLNVEIWTLVWTLESWNHYRIRVLINERETGIPHALELSFSSQVVESNEFCSYPNSIDQRNNSFRDEIIINFSDWF